MAGKSLQDSALFAILSNIFSDLSRLLQQEVGLAKAEISQQIEQRVRGSIWLGLSGVLATLSLLAIIEASILALWRAGFPAHWASLIVALALAAMAAAAFFYGRSTTKAELTPKRSMASLTEDIKTVKEQLS